MADSNSENMRNTSEAILRSLSHDLREPIRSIRRTFHKLKEEFVKVGETKTVDELADLDAGITIIGEVIREYRANTKEKSVSFWEISNFLRHLIEDEMAEFVNELDEFQSLHRQSLAKRPFKAFFDTAIRQAARFRRRLGSLLSFAEAEGGLIKTYFGLHNEIAKVKEELGALIETRNVKVTIFGNANLTADQIKIAQVIQNLFENSITYNEQKKPIVTFTVDRTNDLERLSRQFNNKLDISESDVWVTLRCEDNGKGIPDGEKENVLKAFVRGSTNGELNLDGSGLGLAICKSVVDAHGGCIVIESIEGRGTIVKIAVPAR